MLILDENVSESEIWRLRELRIPVRVIGVDIANKSVPDENIIPLLLTLKRPTLFTRDRDFWNEKLCHADYSIVFLDLPEHEGAIADAIRRFLRHPQFNTAAKRLGRVIQLQPTRINYWHHGQLASIAFSFRG